MIDITIAIIWSWILWHFITGQGAAAMGLEQLKEQLHGYFGFFGTLSGVTVAWDISNNRELKVAGPWICFHGIATPTPQPSKGILGALLSRPVECPVLQASRHSGGNKGCSP